MNTIIALSIIIGVVLIFWLVYRIARGPQSTDETATSGGLMGLLSKNKENLTSIAIIAVALGFMNYLCYLVGWHWWVANWNEQSFFYISMAAILFSCRSFMTNHAGGGKLFVTILLVTVLAGWITIASRPMTILVKAGHWSDPIPVNAHLSCDVEPGIGYTLRPNNNDGIDMRREANDTSRISFPAGLLITQVRVKPDKDMKVTIVSSN